MSGTELAGRDIGGAAENGQDAEENNSRTGSGTDNRAGGRAGIGGTGSR